MIYHLFDVVKGYLYAIIHGEKPVHRQLICYCGNWLYSICNILLIIIAGSLLPKIFKTKSVILQVALILLISFFTKALDLIYYTFLERDKKIIKNNSSEIVKNGEDILQIKKEVEIYANSMKLSYESSISTEFITAILGFIIGRISNIKPQNMETLKVLVLNGILLIFLSFASLEAIKEFKRYKFDLYQILISELDNLNKSLSSK